MIYWILFLLIEYSLLFFYHIEKNSRKRSYIVFALAVIAVYFAGFRDCLGADYEGYRDWCERNRYNAYDIWFLSEPLLDIITEFCANTKFSAVIFFSIMGAATSIPAFFVYSKSKNFPLAAFVYLTYTGIYLFSFNIVRQFAASGLCLCAAYFLTKDKNKYNSLMFIAFVLLASLIHKSSLLFLLTYFVTGKDLNIKLWLTLLMSSILIPFANIPGFSVVSNVIDAMDYTVYLDYSSFSVSKTSLSNIYMHLLLLPFFLNKNKIMLLARYERYVFAVKMYVIFLICNNMSANGLDIAYRIGIFFVLFVPIALSVLPEIMDKRLSYIIIIIPLLFLFFYIGLGNPLFVPDKMLPLNSIFDSVYYKFH